MKNYTVVGVHDGRYFLAHVSALDTEEAWIEAVKTCFPQAVFDSFSGMNFTGNCLAVFAGWQPELQGVWETEGTYAEDGSVKIGKETNVFALAEIAILALKGIGLSVPAKYLERMFTT